MVTLPGVPGAAVVQALAVPSGEAEVVLPAGVPGEDQLAEEVPIKEEVPRVGS